MAVVLNPSMTEALGNRIQPKLVEIGWSAGGEDSSPLSEYICLMLQNGKSQEQIASELSGDLLGLDPDDLSATEFSRWLFEQVDSLKGETQRNGNNQGGGQAASEEPQDVESAVDHEMGDLVDGDGVPTAPKAMRQPQGRRLFNQLAKAMDRTAAPDPLHRVRPQAGGIDRRDPPKGPFSRGGMRGPGQLGRQNGPPSRIMNGRNGGGPPPSAFTALSPQQQMHFYQLYQQQSQVMAPYMGGPPQPPHMGPMGHHHPHHHHPNQMPMNGPMGMPPMMGGGGPPMGGDNPYGNNFSQPRRSGGSLFDRIQAPPPENSTFNNHHKMDTSGEVAAVSAQGAASSSDASVIDQSSADSKPLDEVSCKFASNCTKPECPFAHPTPAAIPGKPVTYVSGEKCSFGAGCRNRKCTGSHPSPAASAVAARPVKIDAECKFFPNCTNPSCPFKHPDMPLCRNGANCTRPGCHFTHTEVKCKFNPCLNPNCAYKHDDGQQKGSFDHKVWTKDNKREHVSERRFVNEDEEEELIIPGQMPATTTASSGAGANGGGNADSGDMDTAPVEEIE